MLKIYSICSLFETIKTEFNIRGSKLYTGTIPQLLSQMTLRLESNITFTTESKHDDEIGCSYRIEILLHFQ